MAVLIFHILMWLETLLFTRSGVQFSLLKQYRLNPASINPNCIKPLARRRGNSLGQGK